MPFNIERLITFSEIEGLGKTWPWPTFMYYPVICMKELRKTAKQFRIVLVPVEIHMGISGIQKAEGIRMIKREEMAVAVWSV
jgi:hypothetical protein